MVEDRTALRQPARRSPIRRAAPPHRFPVLEPRRKQDRAATLALQRALRGQHTLQHLLTPPCPPDRVLLILLPAGFLKGVTNGSRTKDQEESRPARYRCACGFRKA